MCWPSGLNTRLLRRSRDPLKVQIFVLLNATSSIKDKRFYTFRITNCNGAEDKMYPIEDLGCKKVEKEQKKTEKCTFGRFGATVMAAIAQEVAGSIPTQYKH
jgi:hypothetical protein